MAALTFFAFTTILGWNYYGERCMDYLTNGNKVALNIYRWVYIIMVFIGPFLTVSAVWNIADIFNGLMAIPNMVALFALSGVISRETRQFFKERKYLKQNEDDNQQIEELKVAIDEGNAEHNDQIAHTKH